MDKLRSLVALAFSDQMLLHTNPRWACGGTKKKQEEQAQRALGRPLALG